MIYYVLMKGKGEGCDYTIGCNQVYKKLEALDIIDAKIEVNEIIEYYGGINREYGWEEIKLIECTQEIERILYVKEWSGE